VTGVLPHGSGYETKNIKGDGNVMKRRTSILSAALSIALLSLATFAATTVAEPASGVVPTVLARGTYPSFNVRSDPQGPVTAFRAHSTQPVDVLVRQHDYVVGAKTGWHRHPAPVFITVTEGTLTFYEYGDKTCTPHVLTKGQGYVDTGAGHEVRNESGQPAQDVSVVFLPVGAPSFRTDLPAPNPNCGF
jgi:quercetin dioxygenase-like cupin family protein